MQDFDPELHPPHTSAAATRIFSLRSTPSILPFTCVLLVRLYPSKCDVVSHLKAFVHSLHLFWGAWTSDSLRQSLRLQLLCAPTLLMTNLQFLVSRALTESENTTEIQPTKVGKHQRRSRKTQTTKSANNNDRVGKQKRPK